MHFHTRLQAFSRPSGSPRAILDASCSLGWSPAPAHPMSEALLSTSSLDHCNHLPTGLPPGSPQPFSTQAKGESSKMQCDPATPQLQDLCCPRLSWGHSSTRPWAGIPNSPRPGFCRAPPRPLPTCAHQQTLEWPEALMPASCLPSRWNDQPHPDLPGKPLLVLQEFAQVRCCLQCSDLPLTTTTYLPLPTPHSPSNVHFLKGFIPVPREKISAQ